MLKFINSPLVRISFGLAMLTVSMLLITDLLGLVPDTKHAELQSRKIIAESLAVQLSSEIADGQIQGVEDILRSVVHRNDSLLSIALRADSGDLLTEFGGHAQHWTLKPGEKSTATQVQVPLFNEQGRWGSVELSYNELANSGGLFSFGSSFGTLILVMGLAGFLAYLMFLKRTMRELNPDAVIPERVRNALDTLTEGLLIVDQKGFIVFSNSAFARKIGRSPKDLVGREGAGLDWQVDEGAEQRELPWTQVLEGKTLLTDVTIKLKTELAETFTFTVKATPITATAGKVRGALVTLDDITEIEIKNEELRRILNKLEKSKREIARQNQALQVLATRDPLTGALNRRALFEGFETLFNDARELDEELSCIMVDIDHFKLVNDRFGHAVGDAAIKFLSKTLTEHTRQNDLVGRYGGEEFCLVLPGVDIKAAAAIAERMRQALQEGSSAKFTNGLRLTSSFGVSSLAGGAGNDKELVDQADVALYAAKESGRNRVVDWPSTQGTDTAEGAEQVKSNESLPESEAQSVAEPGSSQTGEQQPTATPNPADSAQKSNAQILAFPVQDRNRQQALPQIKSGQAPDLSDEQANFIPSSGLFFDRVDQAIKRTLRQDSGLAVLVMDVDTLQRVNDTLGLAVGEKCAKVIVARLKHTLRLTDSVAVTEQDELLFSISRLGSNRIAVLLTDLQQPEIVTTIMQRIFSALKEPFEVEEQDIYFDVNIGVSVFPGDGTDPPTLIRNASAAMREAKQILGSNNFRFCADDINRRAMKQIQLEAELHRAVEREELTVYYQPRVDLSSGHILSLEALVRWRHPQLGLVPPNDFIPVAEQTGLIEEISRCVIRAVCRQIKVWQDAGYGTVTVAINLSPVEFRNPKLGEQIIAQVNALDVPTSALEIEITETAIIQSMDTAAGILNTLSNAGMEIALDDFGTGYSSLSYLKRFPLRKVKIDRSFISDFVQDSHDATIVSAIIAMSHSLGLQVVAEGVETEEQLRFLQDLHCNEIQGFLISKPVPREEVSDLFSRTPEIRRLITDYSGHFVAPASPQVSSSTSVMMGVLNDFPQQPPPPKPQGLRKAGH